MTDPDGIYRAEHFDGSRFFNPWPAPALAGVRDLLAWQTARNPHRDAKRRSAPLPVVPEPLAGLRESTGTEVLWLGHASFLIQTAGRRLLIDPVFGRAGGVVKRVTPCAVTCAELPTVDAVLITHGHHDHLDGASVRALGRRFGDEITFVVPRGMRKVLPRACRTVRELDWWQQTSIGDVDVRFVPAQHWHRRGVTDTNRVLWGGYLVAGEHVVYHSGDTGYFGGFGAIGRAASRPIDLALLPTGAYEPEWFMGPQHMSPSDSLRAFGDLAARHTVAMHWGSFDLSDEPVNAGPLAFARAARQAELGPDRVHVLHHGGTARLRGQQLDTSHAHTSIWEDS